MRKETLWITQTGILTALLVVVQAITSGFGNQFLTGSLVNLILIVAVMVGGLACGLTVAGLSPLFAKLFGIGPAFWQIVLFIMIGNMVLVFVWHLVTQKLTMDNDYAKYLVATVVGAVAKFLVLFLTIVKFTVPIWLKIPAPKASIVSAAFSTPQLVTALIGGVIATVLLPTLLKAIRKPVTR